MEEKKYKQITLIWLLKNPGLKTQIVVPFRVLVLETCWLGAGWQQVNWLESDPGGGCRLFESDKLSFQLVRGNI